MSIFDLFSAGAEANVQMLLQPQPVGGAQARQKPHNALVMEILALLSFRKRRQEH